METRVGNITAYYEVHGEGFPIIMLHGWGVDHRILKGCVEPIFSRTKKPFKRIYVDLPGMGGTSVDDSIASSDDMRRFVMEFIDQIIPEQNYLLVGKSYGGYLSRGIAKTHSNRVSGIFQICPIAFCETQLQNAPRKIVLEKEECIQNIVPAEEWEYFDLFHVRQTVQVWERYKENVLPGTKMADLDFLNNVLKKAKKFEDVIDSEDNSYMFPTVFLCGRQDWCVGYSDLYTILEQYKRASFVVVDKAGHNLEYEQPEIFGANFIKWIEDVEEFEGML